MNYAFKMMAVVLALGVWGIKDTSASVKEDFVKAVNLESIIKKGLTANQVGQTLKVSLELKNFISKHKGHPLAKDAFLLKGKMHFNQKQYEQAAIALADYNSIYPSDNTFQETTLLITKAATYFAQKSQLCDILQQSLEFMINPTKSFSDAIHDMEIDSKCKSGTRKGSDFSYYYSKSYIIKEIKKVYLKHNLETEIKIIADNKEKIEDKALCKKIVPRSGRYVFPEVIMQKYVREGFRRNLHCTRMNGTRALTSIASNKQICDNIDLGNEVIKERDARGLNCGVKQQKSKIVTASNKTKDTNLYNKALNYASKLDFIEAEKSFKKFISNYPKHKKYKDAKYWLGRTYFAQKKYEKAAITLAEFNSLYPNDSRFQETTLLIAESAIHFAPKFQLCDILSQSLKYMINPSVKFVDRINFLKNQKNCNDSKSTNSIGYGSRDNLDINEKKITDKELCRYATDPTKTRWALFERDIRFVDEAQRRGLDCGIKDSNLTVITSKAKNDKISLDSNQSANLPYRPLRLMNDSTVCYHATKFSYLSKVWKSPNNSYVVEANYRGLSCGINNSNNTVIASSPKTKSSTKNTELEKAKREAEELRKKLTALEKIQKKQQSKPKTIVAKKPKSEFPLKPIPINFPSVSVKRDNIAVIIGNANYKKQGKDIPNVNPAYADAEGIKQYFMKAKGVREGNIIYLKDATGAQLLGVFGNDKSHKGKLFNYIKPNKSNVYIYYAGHGAPGKEGDAYLVPTDTDSQTIEFTGYPLSTLYSNLGKLPAKSMTVILEACFSGGSQSGSLISRASPIVIQPKKTFIPNNIKVIAAGSERQMASWEEDSSHSLFTKYFLKAMSGEGDSNKDGKVSDAELKEYLSDTMTYYARRYYGRDQKVQIHNGG